MNLEGGGAKETLLAEEKSLKVVCLLIMPQMVLLRHSNDSHQCPILAADFVIIYYGIENGQAIQAGEGSEWEIEIGRPFSIP